jgi:hypothetical protein
VDLRIRDAGVGECPTCAVLQVERPVDTLGTLAFTEAVLGGIGTAFVTNLTDGYADTAWLCDIGNIRPRQEVEPADLVFGEIHTCRLDVVISKLDDQSGSMRRGLDLAGSGQRQQGAQPKNH